MTRKRLKKLAEIIAGTRNATTRHRLCELIGNMCKEMNPRFNWDKWHIACYNKQESKHLSENRP